MAGLPASQHWAGATLVLFSVMHQWRAQSEAGKSVQKPRVKVELARLMTAVHRTPLGPLQCQLDS